MKNKTVKAIIIYLSIAIIFALVCYLILSSFFSTPNYLYLSFIKDLVLILIIGFLFKYITDNNNTLNQENYNKLKSINEDINESNERYNIVAKATSDTIWDWKITEDQFIWNKGIETIFGYKQDEIGDSSDWWFKNIHPEDTIKMSVKLYSFLEQKTTKWQDQYRFRCADGSYKYVLDRGFLILDENGKAQRMIGALQDITKQKEEENRLKLLETVITQAKDAIIITKPSSKNSILPKIIYINPAFSKMTGYTAEEIIGKSPMIFRGPKSDIRAIKQLIDAIKKEEECFIETISYKKNKEEFWVEYSMFPIYDDEKKLSHWVSIQRDITEGKKLEKEKEFLIRELTQNNNDLKQFSYITSHNLRAPLSNLTGLMNLINDIPIENTELSEILEGFKKSTQLLNETINDLVKVIVIKDNSSMLKESINIKHALQNIFSQLSFKLQTLNPILELNFPDDLVIKTNKSYFESIFINLITNSIRYRSKDRKLKITINAEIEGNQTKIVFLDNGIGIDLKRHQDKIFGLYQRFHNYPNSKGLGLYLVHSQVEAMGGKISIRSEINKGTEFTIIF